MHVLANTVVTEDLHASSVSPAPQSVDSKTLRRDVPMPPAQVPIIVTLSRDEMRANALAFSRRWAGPQREEADAKTFLDEFFQVFGRNRRVVDAQFEHRVERDGRGDGRIDLFWPGKFVVEMKSTGRDLAPALQQALDYVRDLEPDERPRWVMVSDFERFQLFDLGEQAQTARTVAETFVAEFRLSELADKIRHFAFIRDEEQALFQTEELVNKRAVKLLGKLHDELKASGYSGHRLERFLVRVLFCLFAEDTDIFEWNSFTKLIEGTRRDGSDLGPVIARLFQALDTDGAARTTALPAQFQGFPYVNGGLFAERLDIADMTESHRAALLACCRFDWSKISPGVFGSLFQGVMEEDERRELGAHYTSEENIRRVIDPLFLDELKSEFSRLLGTAGRRRALEQFHDRLASLRFFDPACGCGNFLVVAYRELRNLELELLQAIYGNQLAIGIDVEHIARVNVDQFYGIELEEFPALIAETAMWLTDHQVNIAFSKAFGRHYVRIPLRRSATIRVGNALRLDWRTILPPAQCSYVLGNPPFAGQTYQTDEQKADQRVVMGDIAACGVLDYVCNWYVKAADYIQGTSIRCAFVSTNSISQGEQVGILWSHLFARYRLKITYAHRTFAWRNEAAGLAAVHVVIIGFSVLNPTAKTVYEIGGGGLSVPERRNENISPYLIFGPDVVVTNRSRPLGNVPKMSWGNKPTDGGNLILDPDERDELLRVEPQAAPLIRPYLGGRDFINGVTRYCLWLVGAEPALLRRCPLVLQRIERVRQFRLESEAASTRAYAAFPTLFRQIAQPNSDYLAVPEVSSENRQYIPMAFLSRDVICSNTIQFVPNATPYVFGTLSSEMHMAWVRTVAGRLESRYRYSNTLVYNNFPWPSPDDAKRDAVERAARALLSLREQLMAGGATYADLYDPNTMPPTLVAAHRSLDRAVDRCYRAAAFATERDRFEYLFGLYQQQDTPLAREAQPRRRRG